MNPIQGESVLDLGAGVEAKSGFVSQPVTRATDPNLDPAYSSPADFAGQYPNPLDPTEILRLCEEVTLWNVLPEVQTGLSTYTWREMTSLNMISGSTAAHEYLSFQDGYCPEQYKHDGEDLHVHIKNIGAKKNLSIRDIKHSTAVAAGGFGIGALVGPADSHEGLPGEIGMGTFQREVVRNVKEKEVRLAMTLVMNGWDELLVNGDSAANALEFDGIESWATNQSCTMHTNDNSASGTFSATSFDRFLSEGCAMPTAVLGHPQAIQEMLLGYYTLGFQGSQVISYSNGDRITPGFNFAGFVNTGAGRLQVIADNNFRRNAAGATTFQADLWALRMTHNGDPLVYKITQIPLSYQDLTPGCTAISFEVWAATALVIKNCCMHGKYTTQFTGRITSTCTLI